ncbi:MAG: class I SAM-dependent methyltransferase [Acidimicrobiia bacterium]|nr:class I SAM-dependent methyltransferase [Acidimicrobiia bacterium]
MTHPALQQDLLERLRRVVGVDAPPPPPPEPEPEPQLDPNAPVVQRGVTAAKRLAKRLMRRAIGPVLHEQVTPLSAEVQRIDAELSGPLNPRALAANIESLRDEVLDQHQLSANFELLRGEVLDQHHLAVNLELLKSEVRGVQNSLEELGRALAPDVGLAGARMRFAELRDRVNTLDRRFRAAGQQEVTGDPPGPPPDSPAGGAPIAGFDYIAFERRFRGDSAEIMERTGERYVGLLADRGPVLDVGCGLGELMELLVAEGTDVIGVDTHEGMVREARERGLDVHCDDAISFLARQAPASLGAVVAIHVIEHLHVDQLVELLELAATRLRPGGLFVAETPNPRALAVLGNSYILDPTHVWPLHPGLVTFLCESAGFCEAELRYYSPGEQLERVDDPDAPAWVSQLNAVIDRINDSIFGPQEYAIVASTKPG